MPRLHSNILKNSVLWKYRDTCDSKKAKTPVVCAYVRARGRVTTGIFTNEILGIRLCFLLWDFSTPQVFIKTTRRLWRNDLSFSKSDPLFFEKWLVVFLKNEPSFSKKQYVIFEETTRRKKMEVLQNPFLQHLHWVCDEEIKARHQVKQEGR